MTLLAVGGLGEDIQCIHVQYHIYAYALVPTIIVIINFCGFSFVVSKLSAKTTKIGPLKTFTPYQRLEKWR